MKIVYIVKEKTTNFECDEPNITELATFTDLKQANKMVDELTAFWGDKSNKFGTYYYFWVSTMYVCETEADYKRILKDLKDEWEDIR